MIYLGWVDNLNGPVGIMIAAAKGVLRTLLCNGEFSGECIPVDFACNGIIGITKQVATSKLKYVGIKLLPKKSKCNDILAGQMKFQFLM